MLIRKIQTRLKQRLKTFRYIAIPGCFPTDLMFLGTLQQL